jgi:hypothetical protein
MKRVIIEKKSTTDWNFEAYTRANMYRNKEDAITIYANGSLMLSSGFIHKFSSDIKDHNYAKLYYDASTNLMGLKFCSDREDRGSRRMFCRPQVNNRYICIISFLKCYSLDLKSIVGKYIPKKEFINKDIGHLWVISLKDKEL